MPKQNTTKTKAYILSFGLGGHSIESVNSLLTGYERPEGFQQRISEYDCYDFSETVVIDKRAILEEKPFFAFKSPLVNCKLAGAEVSACPQPDPLFAGALASDPGNAFGGLLALQTAHKAKSTEPGPLDMVSPQAYTQWWRAAGAQIGRIADGQIVWEVQA